MVTITNLNEDDFYKNLLDPYCLDLFSYLPEPTYEQKPEYIGLSQEVIFQKHKDLDISLFKMQSKSYAEIRFNDSTLGLVFNTSGICYEALLFDDTEESEGLPVFHLDDETLYLN